MSINRETYRLSIQENNIETYELPFLEDSEYEEIIVEISTDVPRVASNGDFVSRDSGAGKFETKKLLSKKQNLSRFNSSEKALEFIELIEEEGFLNGIVKFDDSISTTKEALSLTKISGQVENIREEYNTADPSQLKIKVTTKEVIKTTEETNLSNLRD